MTTKHTPGPWHIGRKEFDRHGGTAIQGSVPTAEISGAGYAALVSLGASEAEMHANAALIAAAPDMLAALRAGLAALRSAFANAETCDVPDYADEAEAAMVAAIAKAGG